MTVEQYRTWAGRFLREDGLFTLFGLMMLLGALAFAAERHEGAEGHAPGS